MSIADRVKLYGPDGVDRATRLRAEAELEAEAEQRQRRSEERDVRRRDYRDFTMRAETETVQALRHELADVKHELANVQAALLERDKDFLDVVKEVISGLDRLGPWTEKAIDARARLVEGDLRALIAERFGELRGQISALGPHPARATKDFKFASERDNGEVIDLPNWRNRTTLN